MGADGLPWPTSLGGVSVTFGGMPAAIVYVSPQQINVQVPWSALEQDTATRMAEVIVTRDGRASAPMMVSLARSSPGIFTSNRMGTGAAVVMNSSDGTAAAPMGAGARPARIGSVVSIYATGLGPVSPSVVTGQASPGLFRRNTAKPEVLIGGRVAEILYSGLSPHVPGVNEINVVVPAGVTAGNAVPLQIRAGGVTTSDRVTIAIDGAQEPAAALPGANAADIWSYLSRQNFRQNFSLLDSKTQLYQGIAPHSQLLTIFLNPIARNAINSKAGVMPAGSIIVKDAHGPDRALANSLVMYKIPGFDPANNDWYYTTRTVDGRIGAAGSVAGCFGCHSRAKENDFMFLASVLPNPAPNAAAIRDFIQKQNYRLTWRLWPGTSEFQTSAAPHGATVSIWVNEIAFDALNSRTGKMPAGAFVIKENYMPDRTLAALTVMYKSPGFDPANNDWYWLQQLPNGTAAAEGKIQGCITCHSAVAGNDYLYTGSIATLPETKSAAVWDFIQKQDYQKKWKLWPGTTALTAGSAPHGALITTYVNDAALEAITAKRGVMPPGAIVVKENYMPDRTLAATTLMYKSEGFNPDRNDWFWMQRLANGTVPAEGRVTGCINCHAQNAANDYLNLGPLR